MKCELCNKEITPKSSHNGEPLVKGRVCDDCNWKVIRERLRKSKSSTENMATLGTDGPVNVTDPMEDFEKYAKQFKETFVLGETPVRKEAPENKVKVKNGELTGEVDSMQNDTKLEQVEPMKTATEGISVEDNEIKEFARICKKIGLETITDLIRFSKENPEVKTLVALKKHLESLGKDFKIKKKKD